MGTEDFTNMYLKDGLTLEDYRNFKSYDWQKEIYRTAFKPQPPRTPEWQCWRFEIFHISLLQQPAGCYYQFRPEQIPGTCQFEPTIQ